VPQGPFHRVQNPHTQTAKIAKMQELSGELWGLPARGSGQPAVKAYPGPLTEDKGRGIEFTTDIEPMPGSSPNQAQWYWKWTPGVELRQQNGKDYACIAWTSFKNMQP